MTHCTSEKSDKMLWVIGVLRQLRNWGLIGGVLLEVTDKGLATWDQIDKEIQITDEEIVSILGLICGESITKDSPKVALILGFRDERLQLLEFVQRENK